MQVDTGPRQTQKMQKMKKMSNIDPSKKKTGYAIRGLLALSVKVLKWSWKHLNVCLFKSIVSLHFFFILVYIFHYHTLVTAIGDKKYNLYEKTSLDK